MTFFTSSGFFTKIKEFILNNVYSIIIVLYVCEITMLCYRMFKLQMIPDDLLDQLNKLKYLEKTIAQMKEFNDQVNCSLF